ncbi:MAG: hypothetical protein EOO85_21655, partial [Pedobacter sp.]
AIQNYNFRSLKALSKVRMVEVTSGSYETRIYETGTAHPQGWIAASNSPSNVGGFIKPGTGVEIYTGGTTYSSDRKELVVTHELGHIIGFKHTGTTEGLPVSGTPSVNNFSYMNEGSNSNSLQQYSFISFSAFDLVAFNNMYPINLPSNTQAPETAFNLTGGDNNFFYATSASTLSDGNRLFKRWNSYSNSWNSLSSNLSGVKMALASAGLLYYIKADKTIWMEAFPNSIQLPETANDIAANSSGELWIVSNELETGFNGYKLKKWNGNSWVYVQSTGATKIALGPGPNASPVYTDFNLTLHTPSSGGGWNVHPGIQAESVAVCNSKFDEHGNIILYIVNRDNVSYPNDFQMRKWTGMIGDWYIMPGAGLTIAVDDLGRPWHTNTSNNIYYHPTM